MSEISVKTDFDMLNGTGDRRLFKVVESDGQVLARKTFSAQVYNGTEDCANGTYLVGWPVSAEEDGLELKSSGCMVKTNGSGSTMNVNITKRTTNGTYAAQLRTQITMDPGDYHQNDGVINETNKGISAGQMIYVSVTQVHTTPAKGLWVYAVYGPTDP